MYTYGFAQYYMIGVTVLLYGFTVLVAKHLKVGHNCTQNFGLLFEIQLTISFKLIKLGYWKFYAILLNGLESK